MSDPTRILVVEDLKTDFDLAKREIRKSVKEPLFEQVETGRGFLDALESFQPDVILSDYRLPQFDGLKALELAQKHAPLTPFIIWTGSLSEDVAVECMKAGANNYILKENIKRLGPAVVHAMEERQLLMERRRAEQKYQDIFENSPVGIFQSTPEGRFINVNPAMARIYGYDSPSEMIESITSIADQLYLSHEDRSEFTLLLQSRDQIENFEMRNFRKDGAIIWTSTSARAVRDTGENILYYEGFLKDITERKQAEENLLKQEKRFQALIENSLDNISLLTADGTLLWENPGVNRTLGYDEDEFVGRNIFELMHPDDIAWTKNIFGDLLKKPGGSERGIFRLRHESGVWYWTEAIATNLLHEPSVQAIVINYRDITERRQAEEALLRSTANQLGLIESTKDQMWSVDTQYRLIIGNAEFLRSTEEVLGRALAQGESLLQLVIPPELREQWRNHFDRALRGEEFTIEVTTQIIQPPQHREVHFNPIFNSDRQTIGVAVSSRDITERKQTEVELRQRNDDLRLINAINEAAIYGVSMDGIVNMLARELKSIFSSQGSTIYMLSPDGKSLVMQQYAISPEISRRIEKMIGSTIPLIHIPIQEGGFFQKVLNKTQGAITSDPKEIQKWMEEFVETPFLPSAARGALRKLIPQIYKILNIKSVITIPLLSDGKTIGILDVSSPNLFTEDDLRRLENISRQLTAAIQRQQANEQVRSSQEFLHSVQNALSASIAILNEEGTIVQVNSAWRKFGEQNGLRHPKHCIGLNYLEVCDTATSPYAEEASLVASAIREVIAGRKREVQIEYPCHSPEEKRWFTLHITKFEEGDQVWAVLAHENITERKQAEENLRRSEEQYRYLFENNPHPMWAYDLKTLEFLAVNDAAVGRYGYSRNEFLHMTIGDIRPVEDVERLIKHIEQPRPALQHSGEWRHKLKDGTVIDVDISSHTLNLFGREAALVVAQNITERKRSEQALKETSEQFRTLFEASPEAIMLVDPQGDWKILDCNATGCAMNGYTRDELIGQSIDTLTLTPGDPTGRLEYLESIRRAGILRYETSHRHKDGTIFPIEVSTSLITLGGKEVVLGIDRDITERKAAEEEVRKANENYRNIFENAVESIHQTTPDGRYLTANPATARILGYETPEELMANVINMGSQFYVDARRRDEFIELMESHGVVSGFESEVYRKDGSTIWVSENVRAIRDEQGTLLYYEGTSRDITERKKAEKALLKSEQRYHALFDDMPIAVWEDDLSGIKKYFDSLKQQGITDFRRYLEAHPEELIHCRRMVKILDVNKAAVKMYQAKNKEELIQSALDEMGPGELKYWIDDLTAIANGKTYHGWEGGDLTMNDTPIEISLNWTVVPGYEHDYSRVIFTTLDITERKQMESKLQASETRYRLATLATKDVIWEWNPNDNQLIWTENAQTAFGYSSEEVGPEESWWDEHLHPEDRQRVLSVVNTAMAGNDSFWSEEYRFLLKDGSYAFVNDHGYIDRDANGTVTRLIGAMSNITERKRAETAEHEQRTLAEALRDTAETLNSTLEYGEVLDHILAAAERVVPHDAATIMLIEGELAHVVRAHGYDKRGLNDEIMGVKLPLAETNNLWQMLETGQPLIVYDTHAYTGWKRLPITDWLRSNVGAPISIQGEVIGFILLDSETIRFFSPVHAERLKAFANQAALAIHNARLLQQAQEEIVERRQTEEELRRSESRYRTVVENQTEFIVRWNANGVRTFVNDAYCRYFGITPEQALSTSFVTLVHEDDRPAVEEKISRLISGIAKIETEIHRVLKPDGGVGWQEWTDQAVYGDNGQLVEFQSVGRDVTERKRAENELRASEERFRQLANNIQEVFWMTDAISGEEIYISPASEKIWGRSIESMLRDPGAFIEGILPEDRPRVMHIIDEQKSGKKTDMEYRVLHPDGTVRWVWDRAFPIFDESGKVVRLAGIAADVTERKQNEANAQRHLAELEALYENGLAVGRLLNPREIGERIIETFARHLSWHHVAIRLLQPESDNLELVALSQPGMSDEEKIDIEYHFQAMVGKVGQGLSGWTVQTGEPLRTGDVHSHPQYVDTHAGIQSGLYMPLKVGEQVIGVISVESEKSEAFTLQDERLLATLASQAAVAFENARLYQTIQQERERFSELFENSPVATWLEDFSAVIAWMDGLKTQGITDLVGHLESNPEEYKVGVRLIRILDVNHAAVVMNGARDSEELIGRVHELMVDETPSQIMINELELIWRGYTSFGFEMSSRKLDGTLITGIQRVYIPVNNEKPDYSRVIVTSTDITDRVGFETQLRVSEVHYRELADSITDIFFELDQDLHYSHWNKASEALTGFSAEYAIGKSMRDVFGESEEQTRIEQIYREVLEKHQSRTFETIYFLNSLPRAFEINAYPSTRGVSVVAKDVTERKRSESLMQKRFELMEYSAEHALSELMQKALDEISEWTHSAIGFFQLIQDDQITPGVQIWSTDTFQHFHSSQAEAMHKPVDQAGVWAEAIRQRRAVIHNDYESLTGKMGLPEGHAPLIRELILPIIRNEKIVAVIGIGNKSQDYTRDDLEITERFADYAWDIIERKQMVMELAEERNQLAKRVEERTADLSRANSNLARALRVKDEFLANMSHELRTPLNAILGLSESLTEQIAGPLNDKQHKYLTTISESGHHLLSLINDILDLAKIEAGQITLDINKVDVNSVSQASLRMIKQLAQKKNLEVVVEVDGKIGLMWADERRLKQMIVNLMSNAVKFTPENGKIGLQIEGQPDDNKVIITVWDTGIGIKEKDFQRLFQPFVQLDSGLARESTGTGLGLALVAQMARMHGGSVNVTSDPGRGSRFTIVLPWEPALAMDAAERMKVTGKFRAINSRQVQQTILLIEDTQEVVMMIRDYLEIAGYNVVTAQDGIDGITQAKLSHPDLILMDIQMPRMDGLEATQKLRQESEFKYTPIIALTALAMPNDRERCLAAGMNEYISKPVNLRTLVKTIQTFLLNNEEKTRPR